MDPDHPDTGRWLDAWLQTLYLAGASPRQLERRVRRLAPALATDPHDPVVARTGLGTVLLVSIPGMGPVVVATLLGELGDLRRFGDPRQARWRD